MRKITWIERGLGLALVMPLIMAPPVWSQGATIPESALTGPGFALGPDGKPLPPQGGAKPFVDPDAPTGAPAPRPLAPKPAPAPRPLASPTPPAPPARPIGRLPVTIDQQSPVAKAYIMGLQRALPSHGYHPGPATGALDAQTELAIAAYERDAGLNVDTITVGSLKKTLDHVSFAKPPVYARPEAPITSVKPPSPGKPKGPVPKPANARAVTSPVVQPPVATPVAAPIPASSPTPATVATASPAEVRAVQDYLKGQGFDVEADGTVGPDTENAVKAYQASKGLTKDGAISPDLLRAMGIRP